MSQSPRKRKHSEYHDPDYPQQSYNEQTTHDASTKKQKLHEENDKHRQIHDILEREFNRELAFKQQQLNEINERLSKGRHLLDKLRYVLVSSYYKQQDLPLATVSKVGQTLFVREDKGPQMQIHPSLKKLIGKKPRDLSDVMRSCPKRTAAQNAVQTIRAKSEVHKREERKLKQIIRGQGIVIDHSVCQEKGTNIASLIHAAHGYKISKNTYNSPNTNVEQHGPITVKHTQGKPLISARLNNKVKHFIVVGNTSKFIGFEQERDNTNKFQNLTHKWLVYVQAKDSAVPLERYIRKIRFYLHHSYRPNDVIDIKSPPFQVARRGWGEFPIRVQLFFHEEYCQKPVQLLHTVVLDKTLSGIQTLGSETLLEVWLRNVTSCEVRNNEGEVMPEEEKKVLISNQRPTTTDEIRTKVKDNKCEVEEELVDDNLLEFLNKIEATQCSISADIEKIQPTFMASELYVAKSPKKSDNHFTLVSEFSIRKSENLEDKATDASNISDLETGENKEIKKQPLVTKPKTAYVNLPLISNQIKFTDRNHATNLVPLHAISVTNSKCKSTQSKSSVIINKGGKIIMPMSSSEKTTSLPIFANEIMNTTKTHTTFVSSSSSSIKEMPLHNNTPKQVLQKKLVQLVDATGKVKYMQMLVAAIPSSPSTKKKEIASSIASNIVSVSSNSGPCSSVTDTLQTAKVIQIPGPKCGNGTSSTEAAAVVTMRPNIFKIVPENIQTKPRIVTFSSSIATTNSTTSITSTSSFPMLNKMVKTIVSKPNSSFSSNLLKSNGSTTKNVVFHKEGKVYLIDPLQIKLKQQQKKQVSLLKPQVSLLKKQNQKQNDTTAAAKTMDHDYISLHNPSVTNNAPQVHFGLKQQRLNSMNSLQLMQMKRVIFEKHILRQQFTSMQCAAEFILRRLKLIASKDSPVSAFPFVSQTDGEFQSLTAFKQRAFEWLRAKHISRLMRSNKDLQRINSSTRDTFWSTKEIATFARQYAYTPNIKSMPKIMEKLDENSNCFKDLVKSEFKHKENIPCDTLTDCNTIVRWTNKVWPILIDYQYYEDQNTIIDVDNIREYSQEVSNEGIIKFSRAKPLNNSKNIYIPYPPYLENECNLVSNVCKNLSIELKPEELAPNIWHPSTQTVLAQSVNIFLQKIIRNAMGIKYLEKYVAEESTFIMQPSDIAKVLSHSTEFDFLTNNHFGSNSSDTTSVKVKIEKS